MPYLMGEDTRAWTLTVLLLTAYPEVRRHPAPLLQLHDACPVHRLVWSALDIAAASVGQINGKGAHLPGVTLLFCSSGPGTCKLTAPCVMYGMLWLLPYNILPFQTYNPNETVVGMP